MGSQYDRDTAKLGVAADLSSGVVQHVDVAPALTQTAQVTLLSAVTATGASVAVAGNNYNKATIVITASAVTTGGTMTIDGSYDNTNFGKYPIPTTVVSAGIALANNILTISANGTYIIPIEGKIPYLRANVVSRTDGTYTASVILGN